MDDVRLDGVDHPAGHQVRAEHSDPVARGSRSSFSANDGSLLGELVAADAVAQHKC
jgi:hypothetical protein